MRLCLSAALLLFLIGGRATGQTPSGNAHWAFRPPVRPPIPKVRNAAWVQTPVDAFVLARLEAKGLHPPKIADRRTLLRRVYLDVIGLPPTLEEQQRFLADRSPDAWTRVVDDLLARPEYGERWARHWLDLARYAESNGYERDGNKPSAWRYRDYVIDSLNKDKPYDQFVREQIAGDEIEGSNAESQIATTFLRLGTWDDEPAEPKLDRYDQLDDVLGTTSAVFLAQTLRCARCHDHKFEPFTQKDYYRMLACFEPLKRPGGDQDRLVGTEQELAAYQAGMKRDDEEVAIARKPLDSLKMAVHERLFVSGKTKLSAEAVAAFLADPTKRTDPQKQLVQQFTAALDKECLAVETPAEKAEIDRLEAQIHAIDAARPPEPPHGYIWYEDGPTTPKTCVLLRGDPTRRGDEVTPGIPAVLAPQPSDAPSALPNSTGRRLWLARWMTRPDNPLTARVIVNRIWQHHFGEGIVATESDFGVVGQRPKDRALLDWLATELIRDGWSLKRLHRLILLSNTYKMASAGEPAAGQLDPDDTLFWRYPQRRLDAEPFRDSILAVSGQLNSQRGGPSVYPPLPRSVLEGQSVPGQNWNTSDEKQACRRSIYIFVKRSLAVPELDVLDAPDTTSSCERRPISTVAPQALTFLNGAFIRTQARYFAARLAREAGADPAAQVRRAYTLALCRPARPDELTEALAFLAAQQKQIESDARAAKKTVTDTQQKALEAFCLVLLNSNEFAYVK